MISTGLAHQAPPMASALGDVPEGWHRQRIKDVAAVNRSSLPETTDPDYLMRYVDIGSVDADGNFAKPEDVTFADAPSRARRLVDRGDTIVSTVRTYLRSIASIKTDPTDLIVSTGFATVTPGPEVDQRFLYWWLRSTPFVEEIVARSVGVSYPAANASDVEDVGIAVPSLPRQQEIAQFLDVEVERIGALIAEQKHFVERLDARVNNARRLLLLGESGTGEPGWQAGRMKRFVRIARGRFTHRPRSDPALYDGAYPFIQTGDIANASGGTVTSYSQTLNEAGLAASRLASAGTMVMAIAANIGDVARLGFDCCFPDSVVALTPEEDMDADYLLELIRALKTELMETATLNTQLNINVDRLGDIAVSVPSLPRQRELLDELGAMREQHAVIRAETDHQMALLREHREALITAAVTGSLDLAVKVV